MPDFAVFAADDSQFSMDQKMIATLMEKLGPFRHDAPDSFKAFWFDTHRKLVEASGEFLRVQRLTALAFHKAEAARLEALLSLEPSTVLLPPTEAWPKVPSEPTAVSGTAVVEAPQGTNTEVFTGRNGDKGKYPRLAKECPYCGKKFKAVGLHIQYKHPEHVTTEGQS